MSFEPTIAAIGVADARGVAGTAGVRVDWLELGVEAPGTSRSFEALFQSSDATFRRLDRASRALVLAAESAGLPQVLPDSARDATAIVVETQHGSLEIDLRFARGLDRAAIEGAIFPYTLPSASLGEVALRHRLRGPALCLSIGPEEEGQALDEARRLLEEGEARFALACCVDALGAPCSRAASALRAIAVLLALPEAGLPAVAPWPADPREAFARLAQGVRDGRS
jgi:3-oxoacyl-(acyl-carrier-protein) synthase